MSLGIIASVWLAIVLLFRRIFLLAAIIISCLICGPKKTRERLPILFDEIIG